MLKSTLTHLPSLELAVLEDLAAFLLSGHLPPLCQCGVHQLSISVPQEENTRRF